MKNVPVGASSGYTHLEMPAFVNPPVTVIVLQFCEGLVKKVVQVEAHTIARPAAFRCD